MTLTAPAQTQDAFLGIDASLTGRRWEGPDAAAMRAIAALAQQTGLPEQVCRILARAGVPPEQAEAYLAPRLRELMPDPSHLRDLDRAVEVMQTHLASGSRIAVFADYDVDGACSAALLHAWLSALGQPPTIYVPDRIDEGYGPNSPAMEALAADHALILCVDCGTLSHEPIAAARAEGAEVLVLDHHLGGETLPPAHAVINPNRQDETSELTNLCAAGVVYLFLVALNRARRQAGQTAPDLMALLDLVALATVADVAPLTGLNRALVRQGLSVMARRARPGLVALADAAGLKSPPSAYHLGYILGPRINAGGRVGQADLGARLLTTADEAEAARLAQTLEALNAERRDIEAEVLAAATAQAESRDARGSLVWAAGAGWHPGVVGIVAARLKEAFDRPAVVIGIDAAGEGKGSGRSVPGVDLGAAIATCTAEGLLLKGGGHKMAAGLTVAEDRIAAAMDRLEALLARQGAGGGGPGTLRVDGLISVAAATPELIEQIEAAGPFGSGSPAPRFALGPVQVAHARRVGERHLSLSLRQDGATLKAIAFNAFDGPLGPALEQTNGTPVLVAGHLEIDDWGGRRRASLRLSDAAHAG